MRGKTTSIKYEGEPRMRQTEHCPLKHQPLPLAYLGAMHVISHAIPRIIWQKWQLRVR